MQHKDCLNQDLGTSSKVFSSNMSHALQFLQNPISYSEVCMGFLRLPSVSSSELTSSSRWRICNEVLLSLITESSTQVVLWSKTFSLFSNGKAVDLLQGSRLISMQAHLIGGIFLPLQGYFLHIQGKKNKIRGRGKQTAEKTLVNTYIFYHLNRSWYGICWTY